MRRRAAFAAVLLAGATACSVPAAAAQAPTNPDWKQYRYDETHTGFNPAESTIGAANAGSLELSWAKAPAQGSPVVEHGKVLSCTAQACTSRLLTDGAQQWRTAAIGQESVGPGSLSVGDDRLFAVAAKSKRLDVLDLGTGAVLGRYLVPWGYHTPAPFHAGRVYATDGYHGHLYSIDPTDGSVIWKSAKAFVLGDYYASGPTVADNTVYASGCRLLYALREDTGRYRWASAVPGASTAACASLPAVADDRAVVTTTAVDAVDADTGALLWTTPGGGGRLTPPALAYGAVFAVSPDAGTLTSYSATDGTPTWSAAVIGAGPTSVPTVANGLVYVATTSGLHVLDARTGAEVTVLPGSFSGEPVVSNGRVVVDCVSAAIGPGLCTFSLAG